MDAQVVVTEFLAYMSIVCMMVYGWWGWNMFDRLDQFEQKWKIPWAIITFGTIVGLVIFWGFS